MEYLPKKPQTMMKITGKNGLPNPMSWWQLQYIYIWPLLKCAPVFESHSAQGCSTSLSHYSTLLTMIISS